MQQDEIEDIELDLATLSQNISLYKLQLFGE
jgi:hypothetical protein